MQTTNETMEVQFKGKVYVWDQHAWSRKHDNMQPPAAIVQRLEKQLRDAGIEISEPKRNMKKHHNVYVVELDCEVLNNKKFREANPGYDPAKPCLYVGRTGKTPEQRFMQHKSGTKACRYVKKHGRCLRPDFFEASNPMAYDEACEREEALAMELRDAGYPVWWN